MKLLILIMHTLHFKLSEPDFILTLIIIWTLKFYAFTFLKLLIIDQIQFSVFKKYLKNFIEVELRNRQILTTIQGFVVLLVHGPKLEKVGNCRQSNIPKTRKRFLGNKKKYCTCNDRPIIYLTANHDYCSTFIFETITDIVPLVFGTVFVVTHYDIKLAVAIKLSLQGTYRTCIQYVWDLMWRQSINM